MPARSVLGPVMAFVATTNAARAKKFYAGKLGLPLTSEELPFALVFDVQGVMLRVTIVNELTPAGYTVLGWKVPDISAAVTRLQKAGVKFERYRGLNDRDKLRIWTSPSGAKVAWFKDPDGNVLSLTEF